MFFFLKKKKKILGNGRFFFFKILDMQDKKSCRGKGRSGASQRLPAALGKNLYFLFVNLLLTSFLIFTRDYRTVYTIFIRLPATILTLYSYHCSSYLLYFLYLSFFLKKKNVYVSCIVFFCVPFAVFEEMLGRVRERERERDASAWRGPGVGSDQRIVSEFCRF